MSFFREFCIFMACQAFLVFAVYPFLNWYLSDEQKDKRALIRKAVRDSKHPVGPVYSERQRKHYGGACWSGNQKARHRVGAR